MDISAPVRTQGLPAASRSARSPALSVSPPTCGLHHDLLRDAEARIDLKTDQAPACVAQGVLPTGIHASKLCMLGAPAKPRGEPTGVEIRLASVRGRVLVTRGILDRDALDAVEIRAHIGGVEELREDLAPRFLCRPTGVTDRATGAFAMLQVLQRREARLDVRHLGGIDDQAVGAVDQRLEELAAPWRLSRPPEEGGQARDDQRQHRARQMPHGARLRLDQDVFAVAGGVVAHTRGDRGFDQVALVARVGANEDRPRRDASPLVHAER